MKVNVRRYAEHEEIVRSKIPSDSTEKCPRKSKHLIVITTPSPIYNISDRIRYRFERNLQFFTIRDVLSHLDE